MNDGKKTGGTSSLRDTLSRVAPGGASDMARHLLRRTRLLAHRASQTLPTLPTVGDDRITLTLPEADFASRTDAGDSALAPASVFVDETERLEIATRLHDLLLRAERAEGAAAWLRVRLRAERARARDRVKMSRGLDAVALRADLTRDLAQLRTRDMTAVGRVVDRVLLAHGLPIAPARTSMRRGSEAKKRGASVSPRPYIPPPPGWTEGQLRAMAARVLRHSPEIGGDAAYVENALALVVRLGRPTLSDLLRASGYESPMARRRLRLTVEGLVAVGALVRHADRYGVAAPG